MTAKPETLAGAMALAFAEIEGATKAAAGQVGQQKYKYADLTSVIEAIKPALVANGLFFTQEPRVNDRGVEIETVLHHKGGETYSLGCLFVPAANNNAQGFGSALTYARRYALVTAFGVPVEDDDGKAASAPAPKREAKPTNAPEQDAAFAKIAMLVKATGSNVDNICKAAKVDKLDQLSPAQADKVIEKLETKLAEMAKAKSNAEQPADDLDEDEIPY